MINEQHADYCEHIAHTWENLFLKASEDLGLDWQSDTDAWGVYAAEHISEPPYLSLVAGPAHFSFKADPLTVAAAYRAFADKLERLTLDALAAGAFLPREVDALESINLMQENRRLRKAK